MKPTVFTIRLDQAQDEQLSALAARYKVSKAVIVSWAIDALTDYVSRHGGRITLPVDFEQLWQIARDSGHTHGITVSQAHRDGLQADFDHLGRNVSLNEKPASYKGTGRKKAAG